MGIELTKSEEKMLLHALPMDGESYKCFFKGLDAYLHSFLNLSLQLSPVKMLKINGKMHSLS